MSNRPLEEKKLKTDLHSQWTSASNRHKIQLKFNQRIRLLVLIKEKNLYHRSKVNGTSELSVEEKTQL